MSTLLSFSHSARKLNLILPLQIPVNVAIIATLRKSALSDALLSLAPVSIDKIPYLCLFVLLQIWLLTRIAIVFGLANTTKHGYDNKTPRRTKTVEHMGELFFKLQCAHENTLEAIVVATAAAVVASNLGLDPIIFAKLSIFNLLARVVYPFLYAFGPDMIRTIIFTFGFFSSLGIIAYSLFPELI